MTKPQVQKGVNKHKARHVTRLQWDLFCQTGRSFIHFFFFINLLNLHATKAEYEEISAGLHVCMDIPAFGLHLCIHTFWVFFPRQAFTPRLSSSNLRTEHLQNYVLCFVCPVKPNPPDAAL